MFSSHRIILNLFFLFVVGTVLFFHFHHTYDMAAGLADHEAKALGTPASVSLSNDYKVYIGKNDPKKYIPPILPDISQYTVANIVAKAPTTFKAGKIDIVSMDDLPDLAKFLQTDSGRHIRLNQMLVEPQTIVVNDGDYDVPHLYEALKGLSKQELIHKDGDVYTLRSPLLIGHKASLTISGKDVSDFRMAQDQVAFLVSSGKLFILNTKVTGWSEKFDMPSLFQDKYAFRPFLTAWSGSEMYIAGSRIMGLGYRGGKSYGISYSTCKQCLYGNPGLPRPTGAIVGSYFTNNYYGFYSYEADGVAIVGNTYAFNVIYGIDPHDRSRRLIIANNEAYGSGKKHGIIGSRNVTDSWIFGNYSHDNNGSGIMLDRTSSNNIVANNICAHNRHDGITFFESENNETWNNKVYKNGGSGIRVRNSWNIRLVNDEVTDNGSIPVVVYAVHLEEAQPGRDFKLDPYTQQAGADMYGLDFKLRDRKPVFKIDNISGLSISNINVLSGSPIFADGLFPDESDIAGNVGDPNKIVTLVRKKSSGKIVAFK
jgi:poly(beta-D-mannuronate) C5 epimerase